MQIHPKALEYIEKLGMNPHPEGGYYVSTYRHAQLLHPGYTETQGSRPLCTCIYYLLPSGHYSSWHSLLSDELWFFHDGCPITIHCFQGDQVYKPIHLGPGGTDHPSREPMALIPAGTIFGAEPAMQNSYSLVSCVVSPGFDFADFSFADTALLKSRFPEKEDLICRLDRIFK